MKTFKGTVGLDFKAIVPDVILAALRKDAQDEDTTPFLKQCQAQFPTDDDGFLAAIIKNGVRRELRESLVSLLERGGMGGTVSPASLGVIELKEPRITEEDRKAITVMQIQAFGIPNEVQEEA